jgi:ankyrin repeat protein
VGSLVSGAGEMFQWAKLQLSQLQASKQLAMEQDLAGQLSKFAKSTLDELYGTIFEMLLGSGGVTRELVTHAFSWMLYAEEPLTIDTLLTTTAGGSGWDTLSPEGVLDICRGFIHIDSQSRVVRFDHQSVRTFLQSQALFLPQQAQSLIALSCLRIFKEPPLDDPTDLQPTQRPYDYALLYFGSHVSMLDTNSIQDSAMQSLGGFLFDQSETSLYTTIWLEHARTTFDSLPRSHAQKAAMEAITSESNAALFPICAFNMIYILKHRTWPPGFDWDQRNKSGYTALYAASYFGHAEVAKFLLDHHADSDVECGRLGSALQCAAYRGNHDVVRVLIDRGADPKLKRHFESAVHAACKGNNEDVVVALLQSGFDVSTRDEYDSIESEIAKAGLAQATTELQHHPLNVQAASARTVELATNIIASGEVNGLNYLLRKSPTANAIPPGSLAISALNGHEKMTTFLIDQGVPIDEAGELGTPLRCASIHGHNNICNILLGRGVNINDSGPFGSALHAASMRGHLHTARLLLDAGADVNIRGGYYGTPLQAAAYHGHVELVQLLLVAKADVHASGFLKDALHAAAEGGRHSVVQLFLDAGHQPLAPISYLSWASEAPWFPSCVLRDSSPRGRDQRELRRDEAQTDSNAPLDPFDIASGVRSPFQTKSKARKHYHGEYNFLEAAASLGHQDVVVAILSAKGLSQGAEEAPQVALMTACRHGHVGIVEMMMSEKYRSRVELRKPLHEATQSGHDEIVHTMLDQLLERQPPSKGIFKDILLTSIPDSPRIFDDTMQRMERALPPHDVQSIMSTCLPEAASAGWVEAVETIAKECTRITSRRLTHTFKRACDEGRTAVASAIYLSADPAPISTPQLVRRTRAAAGGGHKDLLLFLLSQCPEAGLEKHVDNMICLAASDGMHEIMDILLIWATRRQLASQTVLDTALVAGAWNGHEKVCAHLISRGASPVHEVSVPRRSHMAIKRWRPRVWLIRDSSDQATSSSGPESKSCSDSDIDVDSDSDNGPESAHRFPSSEFHAIKHDAVQSCLAGYNRFTSTPIQDEATRTRTLRALLDSIVSFDEKHWSDKADIAARSCPPKVLEILLQKGVSVRSAMKQENLLQAAAIRKRWNLSTMQLLLRAGADQDLDDSDLRKVLVSSLAQFDDSEDSTGIGPWDSNGLFPAVQSLDELFETGCGAVVEYLLSRLPPEDASGNGYAVLLQTAAAAGRLGLVELLIARNIDVNAMGSYYGTVLQAACRFAHTGVAEALLQAGADPNLIQGEYYTALRAAVVSKSLPTVLLLLRFQADTELTGSFWGSWDLQPTALYLAVQGRHAAIATALLDAGAHIENAPPDKSLPTLLVSACDWGECSVVRRLIEAGADLQATRTGGFEGHKSAMHAAISCGHDDVVQTLISCGFDWTTAFSDASSATDPLTFAVSRKKPAVIPTLLQHLPRGCDTMLLRASKAAIQQNLVTTLVQLLDAAWDAKSVSILLDLCRTACRTPHDFIVELLCDHFSTLDDEPDLSSALATIDVRELRGELFDSFLCYAPYTVELFVEACVRGDLDLVQRGVDLGYRPDSEDKWARSPLHLAAAQGRSSVVQRLLETGADVNCAHSTYGTALVTTLEGLSADKLTSKSTEDSDRSYVTELAELDNRRCLDVVYANSPRHTWHPSKRRVPFEKPRQFRASTTEYAKTISVLLSKGAHADCLPGRFGAALTLAAFAGLHETFDLLLLHGAKIDGAGGILGSPLSAAVDQGHMEIVDRILASMGTHKIPEENIISLLKTGTRTPFIKQLLDKKAVTPVTAAMLASAEAPDRLKLLLEYDLSYVVTSLTIDAIQPRFSRHTKEMMEMLLLRNPSLRPTESQVCKYLEITDNSREFHGEENEGMHLLDLMFSRNPDLSVTQVMLETVRTPGDLRVLLGRLEPRKHVVTDRVLRALHSPHELNEYGERNHREELLQIFLDFEPSAKVSSETVQQFLKNCKLDTMERLLGHDKSIVILSESISDMLRSRKIYSDDGHCRLIKILEKHPGQYEMTEEFKATVDSRFRKHSEKHLKEMYYKFADWT